MQERNIIHVFDGWKKIYEPILYEVTRIDKQTHMICGIKSVERSKNGTIQFEFYKQGLINWHVKDMVEEARKESMCTCEMCGELADQTTTCDGKILRLCHPCLIKYNSGSMTH